MLGACSENYLNESEDAPGHEIKSQAGTVESNPSVANERTIHQQDPLPHPNKASRASSVQQTTISQDKTFELGPYIEYEPAHPSDATNGRLHALIQATVNACRSGSNFDLLQLWSYGNRSYLIESSEAELKEWAKSRCTHGIHVLKQQLDAGLLTIGPTEFTSEAGQVKMGVCPDNHKGYCPYDLEVSIENNALRWAGH